MATGAAPAETKVNRARPAATVVVSAATRPVVPAGCGVDRAPAIGAGGKASGATADGAALVPNGRACGRGVSVTLPGAGGAAARCGENVRTTIGVSTMTSAVSRSAKKVRLSMQASAFAEAARERGHTRQAERGDSVRCGGWPTKRRARGRVSRSLRSRTPSNSENNDTTQEAAVQGSPGIRGRGE